VNPAWREKLAAGAATLGAPLDAGQVLALSAFCERLLQWNKKIDLTSIKDPDQIREKHVLDSLAGVPMLRPADRRIADLGSGGGFPGIVLAIVEPNRTVLSVESRGKKVVFQRQVARELGLANFEVRETRIEEATLEVDLLTARALADIDELLRLTAPWLAKGVALLAYKSSKVDEELAAAGARMTKEGIAVVERRDLALPESGEPRTLLRLARA
jgi:16S rRNA (guanine527-N7)-methyltransferase